MSRMGGAGALAPLVADLPPEVLCVLRSNQLLCGS
jgi:hypothetical protein